MRFGRFVILTYILVFACFVAAGAQSEASSCALRSCKYPSKNSDGLQLNLSPEKDTIWKAWNQRALYYLVMGVSNGPAGAADDDFAKADVDSLVEALCKQGFRSLPGSTRQSKLVDQNATVQKLDEEITENLPQIPVAKRPLLLFYYSGHGQVDENFKSLILWGADAKTLDAKYSFSLVEEIRKIRTVYSGDLLVIIDACYSGQAFRDLVGQTFDDRTAVLASSSDDQKSEAIKIPAEGNQLKSSFTYALTQVLQGAPPCNSSGPDVAPICRSVDDGVLGIDKLAKAISVGLAKLQLKHKVQPVTRIFPKDPVGMVGYFCEAVKKVVSDDRAIESGSSDLHGVINALKPSDGEALGIVDNTHKLLATVTAHVSRGEVSTVTVDSLVSDAVLKSVSTKGNLKIVKFRFDALMTPRIANETNVSDPAAANITQALASHLSATEKAVMTVDGIPLSFGMAMSQTLLFKNENSVRNVLSKDKSGKTVFEARPSMLLDNSVAIQQNQPE